MTTEERMRIAIEVTQTAELFGEQMSEGRLTLYVNTLEHMPIDAAIWALREARRRCKFFPKPAEIHELIQGSPDDTAALAWTRFLRAISDVGTYTSVDFGDSALHATIEALGGWHNAWQIVRLNLNELGFKRHEFLRTYTAFKHIIPGKAQEILPGQHAIANNNTRGSWTRGLEHRETYIAIEADGRPGETKQLVSSGQLAISAIKQHRAMTEHVYRSNPHAIGQAMGPETAPAAREPDAVKDFKLKTPEFIENTSAPEVSDAEREAHRQLVKSQALAILARANDSPPSGPEEHWKEHITKTLDGA